MTHTEYPEQKAEAISGLGFRCFSLWYVVKSNHITFNRYQ